MILVRDIFRIKFGQTKQATALWKQAAIQLRKDGFQDVHLLTDLAGPPYYTLVLESRHASLADWEKHHESAAPDDQWRNLYQQIIALTETGHREIYKIIE